MLLALTLFACADAPDPAVLARLDRLEHRQAEQAAAIRALATEPAPAPDGGWAVNPTGPHQAELSIPGGLGTLSGANLGRALLHEGPDGTVDGYRLSAIRRGSLAEELGFRNGDVVHSVNDLPLDSVQRGVAAFEAMKSADDLTFRLTREGEGVTLRVAMR